MLIIFVRTLILYTIVIITMRIMGKRQIGQLQPYELAIAILISDLAAVPMQNTGIPMVHGIIPILTLLIGQMILSFIELKSIKARAIISGKPSILIENGVVNQKNLRKEMYTVNELLEQLRIKDIRSITDVEFATLETNGQLSVIPKAQNRPVTPLDLNIVTEYEGMPLSLIIDGEVIQKNLEIAKVDETWLKNKLLRKNIPSINDVFLASLDTNGTLYIQKKSETGGT